MQTNFATTRDKKIINDDREDKQRNIIDFIKERPGTLYAVLSLYTLPERSLDKEMELKHLHSTQSSAARWENFAKRVESEGKQTFTYSINPGKSGNMLETTSPKSIHDEIT